MLTIHHLNNSRSQRVLWLLEELEIPYRIVPHLRDPLTDRAPLEFRAIHPLGKLPVLEDGALQLAESGAIITYLVDQYGGGRMIPAPGTPERLRYLYWMHYAEGSAMPAVQLMVIFDRIETARLPFYLRPIVGALARNVKAGFVTPQLILHLDYMEAELGRSVWFAGPEITAADLQMSFVVQAAEAYGIVGASRPHLSAFLRRIEQRPAWLRAIERGGPYKL